ncbi:ABC transporter substrate-binding protein [Candidatus Thorarchaeota archaeon]|nr:MAG: ABC transporter substrate-binding protein [Candidatus Thorarchaeota archaeon]
MDDMNRNQLIAVIVIVVVIGAAGAYLLLQPPAVQLAEDQTIIYEVIGLPEYMDPHKNYESAGSWIHFNIYETLFTYPWDTADAEPTNPLLATGYTLSSDKLTYTFTLREGVKFHDGTDFNATAVQMNFWRMLGRGWDDGWGPVWMIAEPILGGSAVEDAVYEYGDGSPEHIAAWENWVENVSAVVVTGDYEVQVKLAYPFAPFIAALTYEVGAMISPTFFMAHGGMSPESDDVTLNEEACGTGPYILDEWVQDDKVVIELNEDYWREALAKVTHPYAGTITKVTFKLNTDINSRMLNLAAGETDACDWGATNAYDIWNNVTTRGDGTLQSINPDIKVWTGSPTFDVMFLGFNMNPYLNVSNQLRQSPFTDYNLRMAISYAFDYDALIDNVMNGIATQLRGPIPAGMFGHDSDLFMFSKNMTAAVEHWNLAMTAGLDTVFANNSYELNIYYNEGNTAREAASLLIAQAMTNIIADPASTDPSSPLTVDAYSLEWASYLYQVRNKQLPFFFLGWAPDYADPDNYAAPFVKSTGTFPSRVGLKNSIGAGDVVWDHVTVDGWIDDAAQETDAAARIALYADIQEAIVEHAAFLWCYQGVEFHVEGAWMNGYVFNPMHDPYFYHYYKVAVW